MTIAQLIRLAPDTNITVSNKPFACAGSCILSLDGDGKRSWIFEEDGGMLAVCAEDEEIISFESIDEEMEPEGGMILYRGKEFEFSYEDAGAVSKAAGDVEAEDDDRYAFSDYESDEGEIVRLVTNENTGEVKGFFGRMVVEEDIAEAA